MMQVAIFVLRISFEQILLSNNWQHYYIHTNKTENDLTDKAF